VRHQNVPPGTKTTRKVCRTSLCSWPSYHTFASDLRRKITHSRTQTLRVRRKSMDVSVHEGPTPSPTGQAADTVAKSRICIDLISRLRRVFEDMIAALQWRRATWICGSLVCNASDSMNSKSTVSETRLIILF
jgi:hypothetical protein